MTLWLIVFFLEAISIGAIALLIATAPEMPNESHFDA